MCPGAAPANQARGKKLAPRHGAGTPAGTPNGFRPARSGQPAAPPGGLTGPSLIWGDDPDGDTPDPPPGTATRHAVGTCGAVNDIPRPPGPPSPRRSAAPGCERPRPAPLRTESAILAQGGAHEATRTSPVLRPHGRAPRPARAPEGVPVLAGSGSKSRGRIRRRPGGRRAAQAPSEPTGDTPGTRRPRAPAHPPGLRRGAGTPERDARSHPPRGGTNGVSGALSVRGAPPRGSLVPGMPRTAVRGGGRRVGRGRGRNRRRRPAGSRPPSRCCRSRWSR